MAQPLQLNTDQLVTKFNSICGDALDSVAPLKVRKPRAKTTPVLLGKYVERQNVNEKKDRLQVSFERQKHCLANYQQSVKAVKVKYLATDMSKNSHSSKVMFHTINSVVNPVAATCPVPTKALSEDFFNFFLNTTYNLTLYCLPTIPL